jgi:hypothetical protein
MGKRCLGGLMLEKEELEKEEIELNRRIAVKALRVNDEEHKQIRLSLTDGGNGYCALGHIAEALHVSPKIVQSKVYDYVSSKLDSDIHSIFDANDAGKTFQQIGDELAIRWGI